MTVNERKSNEELRQRLRVVAISDVVRRNRQRWFGHAERRGEEDWVKRCAKDRGSWYEAQRSTEETWGKLLKKTYRHWAWIVKMLEIEQSGKELSGKKPAHPGNAGKGP